MLNQEFPSRTPQAQKWITALGFDTGASSSQVGVSSLTSALRDSTASTSSRRQAAAYLGKLGRLSGSSGGAALAKALVTDSSVLVRVESAASLAMIGRAAVGEVGYVALAQAASRDVDSQVRWTAAQTLLNLGVDDPGVSGGTLTAAMVKDGAKRFPENPTGTTSAALLLGVLGNTVGQADAAFFARSLKDPHIGDDGTAVPTSATETDEDDVARHAMCEVAARWLLSRNSSCSGSASSFPAMRQPPRPGLESNSAAAHDDQLLARLLDEPFVQEGNSEDPPRRHLCA